MGGADGKVNKIISMMLSNWLKINHLKGEIEMAYVHIPDKYEPYFDIVMDCIKLNGDDIEAQIKKITDDTKLMGECLEDNFLQFKLHSKKVRDEYEKAVDETIDKNNKVWEECERKIADSKPTVEKCKHDINGLIKEINELSKILNNTSFYKIEKLLELIEKFNNMSADEKDILSKLINISEN